MPNTNRLSAPQTELLRAIRNGQRRPPTGYGRDTGRDCSAFWRTAASLERLGLIRIIRGTGGGAYPIGAWFPRLPTDAERATGLRSFRARFGGAALETATRNGIEIMPSASLAPWAGR